MQASHGVSTFCRYVLPIYGSFACRRDVLHMVNTLNKKSKAVCRSVEQTPLSELGDNPYIWLNRKIVEINDELSKISAPFKRQMILYVAAAVAQLALATFLAVHYLPAGGLIFLGLKVCKPCLFLLTLSCLVGGYLGFLLGARDYYHTNRAKIQQKIDAKVREKAEEALLDKPFRETEQLRKNALLDNSASTKQA